MTDNSLLIASHSFAELLLADAEIMRLRDEYREVHPKERRMAAEASCMDDLSDPFARLIDPGAPPFNPGNGSIRALAIDPQYAPAILTVGSIEYQLNRKDAAMKLFMSLLELAVETNDLRVIIDKAGNFLLDEEDWDNSARLYQAATEVFPDFAAFHSGLGYCADKLGIFGDAVEHNRRAVNLDPSDPTLLSDLGWSLIRSGDYEEAEATLLRSLDAAPDHERSLGNLAYLQSIRRGEV